MTQTDAPTVDNGVNIEALRGAKQALTDAPAAAQFQWRASCEWVRGTHSRSTITSFSGLGQEHAHRQAFTVEADHPEVFASEDNGATPPEIVLAALASCLTAGVATVATNRGVQLRSVKATITQAAKTSPAMTQDEKPANPAPAATATIKPAQRTNRGAGRWKSVTT